MVKINEMRILIILLSLVILLTGCAVNMQEYIRGQLASNQDCYFQVSGEVCVRPPKVCTNGPYPNLVESGGVNPGFLWGDKAIVPNDAIITGLNKFADLSGNEKYFMEIVKAVSKNIETSGSAIVFLNGNGQTHIRFKTSDQNHLRFWHFSMEDKFSGGIIDLKGIPVKVTAILYYGQMGGCTYEELK
jgi:hypothetical protein